MWSNTLALNILVHCLFTMCKYIITIIVHGMINSLYYINKNCNASPTYLASTLIFDSYIWKLDLKSSNTNFKLMIYTFLKLNSTTVSLAMVLYWLLRKLKLFDFKNRHLSSIWNWNHYWRIKKDSENLAQTAELETSFKM